MGKFSYKNAVSIISVLVFIFLILFPFKKELKDGTIKYKPKSGIYEVVDKDGERIITVFDKEISRKQIDE
ncbi:MAG: hypothetical protein MJ153_07260 [Clostridia bacterium]|nr:hypothetical protein [Clostridia bacterium]